MVLGRTPSRILMNLDDSNLPSLLHPTPPCTPCEPSASSVATPFYIRQFTFLNGKIPDATVFQPEGHPKQAVIDGEVWPPIFKTEYVRSAKMLEPRNDDVFVCTYPKCGTTWIQHICSQLLQDNYGPEKGKVAELSMTSPMIERMGAKYSDELQCPRLLKTHFAYFNCPKSQTAKYIFAVRNPKDCLVSYYFHNKNFKIYDWPEGDFDTFFELFVNGQLAFGDYFDHLISWQEHMHDENVLFLKYEDMMEDLEDAVKKIGLFIGGKAEEKVCDPEELNKIVEESKIDSMKKNQERWFPGSILRKQTFIRKGGSRDWKNYFSKEQSDRMDAVFRTRLAGTEAEKWWKYEMSWNELLPEIMLTEADESDEGMYSDDTDDLPPSVSRRPSNANILAVYKPVRRDSFQSFATYGSAWTRSRSSSIGSQASGSPPQLCTVQQVVLPESSSQVDQHQEKQQKQPKNLLSAAYAEYKKQGKREDPRRYG
uniref:Sulfotransferase domain-containing protein n=1 Tax=Panagrolaimus sp. ES5 TaxID=591445 RepID=A0AC34GUW7_9BILA